MTWEFEVLQEPYGAVSEGPVWDGDSLIYTQIQACRIMRYDPRDQSLSVHRDNTNYANGLAMDAQGRIYACEGGARRVVRYEPDGSTTVLADQFEGERLNIPNDLVIDPQGRIWFTDPFYEGSGGPFSYDRANKDLDHDSVYCIENGGDGWALTRKTFDTTRPNGLLFSLNDRVLYVAQSGRRANEKRQLRAYALQDDDTLGPAEVLHDFGAHRGIDGMCLDTEGNIVATAGHDIGGPGPSIYVFSPSGEVLQRHDIPQTTKPTNCCFGDEDLRTLYVTTIEGHLLRTRTDRRGRPCSTFSVKA